MIRYTLTTALFALAIWSCAAVLIKSCTRAELVGAEEQRIQSQ